MRGLDKVAFAGRHDQIIDADGFRGRRNRRAWESDVDDALKNDDVLDARLIECVVIEASQAVYAQFHGNRRRIMKNPVAYDSCVQHPEREALLRQPFGKDIRPAPVGIRSRTVAVDTGVAEHGYGRCRKRCGTG